MVYIDYSNIALKGYIADILWLMAEVFSLEQF